MQIIPQPDIVQLDENDVNEALKFYVFIKENRIVEGNFDNFHGRAFRADLLPKTPNPVITISDFHALAEEYFYQKSVEFTQFNEAVAAHVVVMEPPIIYKELHPIAMPTVITEPGCEPPLTDRIIDKRSQVKPLVKE